MQLHYRNYRIRVGAKADGWRTYIFNSSSQEVFISETIVHLFTNIDLAFSFGCELIDNYLDKTTT